MATVIVGVDGSDGALVALRFAVQEARLRGAVLRAVMAWDVDSMAHGGAWGPGTDPTGAEEKTRSVLDAAVDTVDGDDGEALIERVVATGPAAEVLVEQSQGADMLVVGSRGHRGLMFGSVGRQCARLASCPVTIVPDAGRPAPE